MTGLIYLLAHPDFRALKIGFAAAKSDRLEELGRRGWQPYRTLTVATPELAREIEQAALFEIRYRRFVPHLLTSKEVRHGWTETFSLSLITVREAWDVLCSQAGLVYLAPHVTGQPDGRRRNGGTPPRRVPGQTLPYSRMARTQARLERTVPGAKNFRPNDN
ncbi:hypothetical protein ACFWPQ_01850 [Streptomyces sp. NPDC058464]|uniref:hypothetical protein n=1 Tax=Streptomyces sp. NPDC058464 TaxID=3346511 RepID=UPI00365710A2